MTFFSKKKKEVRNISENEMVDDLAGILQIDQASIKKAYEGDKDSLTRVFNQATKSGEEYKDNIESTCYLGVATVFGLCFMPPIGVVTGLFAAWNGIDAYQAKQEINTIRQTVQMRLGK